MAVVAIIVNLILVGGVKEGIEKAAKFMMPALFVLLTALVVYVLTLDNAMAGVKYYVVPDFSKMDASVLNGALAQAFFSLSLGMGILMTYASYISKKEQPFINRLFTIGTFLLQPAAVALLVSALLQTKVYV